MNFLITGTDTDIGKTVVTAGIASVLNEAGNKVCVYKPLQSGCLTSHTNELIAPDLAFVNLISPKVTTKTSYKFIEPVAPSLAAEINNVQVDINKIKSEYENLAKLHEYVILEGAGGLMTPIYESFTYRDLAKFLNLPILIVARPDLGTINHTLLTIEAAKNLNIEILGVIISKYPVGTDDLAIKTAPLIINKISGIKILGLLPKIQNIPDKPKLLSKAIRENIDLGCILK